MHPALSTLFIYMTASVGPSDHFFPIWNVFFLYLLTSSTLDWAYHISTTIKLPRGTPKPPEIPPRWLHCACPIVCIEPTVGFSSSYSIGLDYCIAIVNGAPTEASKPPLS